MDNLFDICLEININQCQINLFFVPIPSQNLKTPTITFTINKLPFFDIYNDNYHQNYNILRQTLFIKPLVQDVYQIII